MPATHQPGRLPGAAFKDGKLLVFEADRVSSVVGWPEPEAWQKPGPGGAWSRFRPKFALVRPYRRKRPPARKEPLADPAQLDFDALLGAAKSPPPKWARRRALSPLQRRRRAFDRFRFSLPKPVAAQLERFTTRQWDLLGLLHGQGGPALELASSRPVLAYLVGLHAANRQLAPAAVAALLALKGKDLVGRLGLPATPAMVRVLEKIHPQSFSQPVAVRLRQALVRDPDLLRQLGHLPEVNAGVVDLLADEAVAARVTPSLLLAVAAARQERYRSAIARVLREVVALEAVLGAPRRPAQFRDPAGLERAHRQLLQQRRVRRRRERESARAPAAAAPFPPPPVPGTPGIVPVTSEAELRLEARMQENCVAMYAGDVRARESYIYRVLTPERCTLEICPDDAGNWHRRQLERRENQPASTETTRLVDRWLARYHVGA
jgi:hypothetical protein